MASALVAAVLFLAAELHAHPISFNSTISYSSSQPSGGAASVSNWTGATFDAANIGGSGTNADGGANNGTTNDASTCVANSQPRQGQTFTTGSNASGYEMTGVTVRMAGYTSNTATASNYTNWNLSATNGPIIVTVGKIVGTTQTTVSMQNFTAGGTGTPGTGSSANGPGAYITFSLPFPVHLEPNTTYGFDFAIGNGGSNYFEWLGISTSYAADPYAGGTAYTRSGGTITPLTGDRVFMANMTASATAYAPFVHPGTLHTQADFDRMAAKVAASAQPWKADYDILAASPWGLGWPAYNIDYIVRGGSASNNYTRSQQDAQAIYELALRWKITGNTAYADKAVQIANVWSDLIGVTGDSNSALASGICGYLFAAGGEILSTYPGWAATEKQAYKDMMMRVFYSANFDFLWRHFDTFWRTGGNTHYRLNWDADAIASMAAIGILCDNKAVYQQAIDYFKYGAGNGRVERAAWYIHPGGLGQGEEAGRDQGHNLGGWHSMALFCQMAWNQGDDLFGYDNNRVLRVFEYNAKYNLGNDVPYVRHQNSDLGYTEGTVSAAGRGIGQYFQYELVYNHYANVVGIAAPWSKLAVDATRPEPRPDPSIHPSQVDWLGLGSLTYARDAITTDQAPTGLRGLWSKNQVILDWWGSARATSYLVKRATVSGGPYTQIGTVTGPDLNFTDPNAANGAAYYYIVTAVTPSGNLDSAPLLVNQTLATRYLFDGTTGDSVGARNASAMGGTSAPGYATGKSGQAISLNGADQYVQLPVGSGNYQDITIAAWVYWTGSSNWQRVFDFGSEVEKTMYLTTSNGSGNIEFGITTTEGGNVEGDASFYLRGSAISANTWVHLAVTLSGDTGTLYVNGKPVASKLIDLVDPLFGQPFCYLGRSLQNADPYFQGRIDDFRIYNYGLSGDEIYTLWGQGGTNSAPVFSTDPMTRTAATQNVNYSASSQTLAGSGADANGGALTYSKVTGPGWLTIATSGALSGTPTNDDVGVNTFVIRVTDSAGATDDAPLRITVNNVNDAPTWTSNPLTKPSVTQGIAYSDNVASSASDVDGGDTITFSKVSGPGWLSVAASGALSGTPAATDAGANSFVVRATDSAGAYADVTLSITVLANSIQSSFSLNGSGADGVGGAAATITGTATYVAGVSGQALSFDGTTNYATLGSLSSLVYKDMTVTAWVYWNGRSAWQRIFDFGSGTDQYLFLTPYNATTGMMRFGIKVAGVEQDVDAAALPIGQWVHVAVTLGGDTATIYVNGIAKASNSSVTNNPNDIALSKNYVGKSQFSADPLFSGKIDDFRIYNYALSASEVAALLGSVPVITPDNVTAFPANGRVRLTWSPSANAATYTVKRGAKSGGPYTTVSGGSGLTAATFADTGVTNGVPYYYVVSAANSTSVQSTDSQEVAATPNAAIIDVVNSGFETPVTFTYNYAPSGAGWTFSNQSGVSGAAISANGSAFTSGNSVAPEGLQVALVQGSGSFWQALSGFIPGASYTVAFAAANRAKSGDSQNWSIQVDGTAVKSFSAAPTSYLDYTASFTASAASHTLKFLGTAATDNTVLIDNVRVAVTPPPVPSGLTAGDISSSQLTLVWGASSGATGYNVKRSTASGGPYTTIASGVSATSFTDTGLTPGVTYRYVVSALNSLTESQNSAEISVTAVEGTPVAPTGLTASPGNAKITLSWAAPFGATSYNVKRAILGGTYSTIGSNVIGASYTDSGLNAGSTYVYKVSATNSGGESPDSAEASATVFSALPTGWSGGNVNGGSGSAIYGQEKQFLISGAGGAFTTSSTDSSSGTMGGFRFLYIGSNSTAQVVTARVVNPPTVAGAQFGLLIRRIAPGGSDNRMAALVMEAAAAGNYQARLGIIGDQGTTTLGWSSAVSNLTLPRWIRLTRNGSSYTAEVSANGSTWTTVGADSYDAPATSTYYAGLFVSSASGSADVLFDNVSITADGSAAWSAPAAPTGLTATLSGSNANLSWTAVSGATSYRIERSSVSGGPYVVVATGVTATSYSDPISSGPWYYIVRTVSATGVSAASSQSGGVTAVPAAPTGVTATPSNAKVSLRWTASSRATSYTVKRAATSGGTYVSVSGGSGLTGTAFTDTGLTNDTAYYYVVTASNSAGASSNSSEVSATPVFLPQAPTGLTATGGDTSVMLNWNAAGTAIGYVVMRSTTSGVGYETVATGVTATSFTDTTVLNGAVYYYVVSAVNNNGQGLASAEIVITPHLPATIPKADNTNNLNLAGSWSGSMLPNANDIAKWSGLAGANSVLLGADFSLKGINIANTGGAIAIGGSNTLTLGAAGVDMSAATQNLTINSNLALAAGNQGWNVASGRTLALGSGVFTRLAKATLNLQGLGSVSSGMTGLSNDATGIIGPWSTVGTGTSTRYATLSSGSIIGFTGAATTWGGTINSAATNYEISATATSTFGGSERVANTIRYTGGTGTAITLGSNNSIGLTVNGLLNAGTGAIIFNQGAGATSAAAGVHIGSGNELVLNAANAGITINANIHNNGANASAVTVTGTGAVTLTGANDFTGGTNLNAGSLVVGSAGSLGSGLLNWNGGAFGGAAALTIANNLTVSGSNAIGYASQANDIIFTGALAGSGTLANYVGAAASYKVSFNGNLSGFTGAMNYTCDAGAATGWWRVGDNNSTVDLSKAALVINKGNVTNLNASCKNFGFADGISGATLKLGALAGDGVFQASSIGAGPNTLEVGGLNTNTTFSGVIAGGNAGTGLNVSKVGTGTLILTGSSPYTGTTNITSGAMVIKGALTGGGAVSVGNGAALGGAGSISGALTVAAGGSLAPGNAGVGVLTVSGALTLGNGSILNVGIGGGENRIALGGAFAATGTTTVNITALDEFGPGTYPLITGTAAIKAANFALGMTPAGYIYALSASNGALSVTVTALPPAPVGLTATRGDSSVTLNWSVSDGATAYYVKRSTVSGGPYGTIASLSTTSCTNTGLTNGATYYYVVSAANAVGESADSTQVSATPISAVESWRQAYFGTTSNTGNAADGADPDGDGMTNAQEFSAGTNPNDRNSTLKVSQMRSNGNDMVVSFPTVVGKSYRLEYSETLAAGSWSPVLTNGQPASNIAGTGGTVQITDSNGALRAKRFYRIVGF